LSYCYMLHVDLNLGTNTWYILRRRLVQNCFGPLVYNVWSHIIPIRHLLYLPTRKRPSFYILYFLSSARRCNRATSTRVYYFWPPLFDTRPARPTAAVCLDQPFPRLCKSTATRAQIDSDVKKKNCKCLYISI